MRRLALLLILPVLLSSCGAFREVFKLKESHKVEITQDRRTDSVGVTVDKSTTIITERVDTAVTIPGATVVQEVPLNMDSLINGMTAIKNDLIDVSLHLNPITGVLTSVATLRARLVPVKLDRVTTKQNDITTNSRKQEAITTTTRVEDKSKTVDKQPIKIPVCIVIIIIVISIIGGVLFWWRKRT